jgi:hypothetical protein
MQVLLFIPQQGTPTAFSAKIFLFIPEKVFFLQTLHRNRAQAGKPKKSVTISGR